MKKDRPFWNYRKLVVGYIGGRTDEWIFEMNGNVSYCFDGEPLDYIDILDVKPEEMFISDKSGAIWSRICRDCGIVAMVVTPEDQVECSNCGGLG